MARDRPPRVHLAAIDLNQLVALDALLAEASVTRAARRVGLSQPAMSHALARLRGMVGDPLLVRAGRRMQLTPRARELAEPLADALGALDRALGGPGAFDPAQARRSVRMAAIDFAQLVLLPPLSAGLVREAPGVDLVAVSASEGIDRALTEGTIDLALVLGRDAPGLMQRELLRERFVCVVRRGHPDVGRGLTLQRFAKLPHALISPRGLAAGAVDTALAQRGLSRRIALTVPSFHAAALAVARSDLVLTVSERVARTAPRRGPLRMFRPPVPLDPFVVTMLWHARLDADPLHGWLRERVAAVARSV
jgi:DNA-binding transcriptional LysR family regulator